MIRLKSRQETRARRHERVRRKVRGTAERPRMAIMVSNRAMYVQFIDDERAVTLAAASSGSEGRNNVQAAQSLGQKAAEAALACGIRSVVVDRGGFKYHGRVRAMVEAATGAGLQTGITLGAPGEAKEAT